MRSGAKQASTAVLAILLLQIVIFTGIALKSGQEDSAFKDKLRVLAIIFPLSAISGLIAIYCLQKQQSIDMECRSKILAALGEDLDAGTNKTRSLSSLSDSIISELEAAKQRERLIADFSAELLCSLNPERRFLELNHQAEELLGYSAAGLLANQIDSIMVADDLPAFIKFLEKSKSQSSDAVFECRIRRQSGELIDLEWQCEWSQKLQCFFCLARDISFQKENQRLKSEISAMITHDLRAPITGISYILESLEHGIYGDLPKPAAAEIAGAQESVEKVLDLINQLLDAEKLETGSLSAELKVVPLCEVYEHCRTMLSSLAASRQLEIRFPESSSLVFADFEKLNQAFCNLVSNAIKFSPQGKVVLVDESADEKSVIVQVKDSGPGIKAELQSTIFERFKTLSSPENSCGTGLGLYIARKLIELQGGSVGVSSTLGKGSCFWIKLRAASESDLPDFE